MSVKLRRYVRPILPIKLDVFLLLIKQMLSSFNFLNFQVYSKKQDDSRLIPEALCWMKSKSY